MFSENINYSKWRVAYTNYFSFICSNINRVAIVIGRFPTSIGRFLFVIFISYSKKDLCNRTGLGIIARWHLPTPDGQ
jgi:hypothetical protein